MAIVMPGAAGHKLTARFLEFSGAKEIRDLGPLALALQHRRRKKPSRAIGGMPTGSPTTRSCNHPMNGDFSASLAAGVSAARAGEYGYQRHSTPGYRSLPVNNLRASAPSR